MYAQTNIQLLDQLRREGYAKAELTLIRDAYELARELYSGYFIFSGRTQIAHVVGTASILGSVHAPAELVAAGILHNVYDTGDFGDGRGGVSDARREQVRRAVGATVEEYVCRFPGIKLVVDSSPTPRDPRVLSIVRGELDAVDVIDRHVLLVLVAERLDHRRNLEYMHEYRNRQDHLKGEMAEALGVPALAAELKETCDEVAGMEICAELARNGRDRSEVITPRSCQRRPGLVLRAALRRNVHRVGWALRLKRGLRRLTGRITRSRDG